MFWTFSSIMAPSLRIQALKIGEALVPLAEAGSSRFDGLVLAHLAPFIDLVADRGGVTKRVLWSNAGNVFEAFSRKLESIAAGQVGLEHARRLLLSPTFCTGERIRYLNRFVM
jgi:ferric iron reductase protein FhuF